MTNYFDDLPMTLRMPGARRLVEHQREQLKMFDDLESSMADLWKCCEAARVSASGKRCRVPIDGAQLQQIVDACETGLLAQVPEGHRIRSSTQATDRTNDYVADMLEDLGDLALFAYAEIGLRVFIHESLKSTGQAYEPDRRLPAWNRAIRDAEARAEKTVDAWRSFVGANLGMNVHGD